MESLFLHEAIPGHHYQTSLQAENTTLPKFRRFYLVRCFMAKVGHCIPNRSERNWDCIATPINVSEA